MFEGKPPRPVDAAEVGAQPSGKLLRPVAWHELVSRLAAARDFRAAISPGGAGEGSFDAGSARRLAARHDGEAAVNPDTLANRKAVASIDGDALPAGRRGVARD